MKLKFLLLLAVLCIAACSRSDDPETPVRNPFTEPNGSAAVLNEKATRYFTSVDDRQLTLAANTPDEYVPNVGDIVCCPMTPNTPDGFLGRVTRVEPTNDGYTVTTEEVALDETFERLTTDERIDPSLHVESVTDEEGNSYAFETVDSSVWDSLSDEPEETRAYTEAYGEATLRIPLDEVAFGGTALSGSLYVDSRLDVGIGIERHKLSRTHTQLSIRTGAELKLSTTLKGEVEKTLKSFDIQLGRIPIAGGAVILRPVLKISLVLGANGEITADAILRNTFMDSSYAIDYANGVWTEKSSEGAHGLKSLNMATKLEMSGELYTEAKAGLLVGVYSHKIIGIGFNAVGRQALSGQFSLDNRALFLENPSVGIDRTLSGEFYFYARLFGKNLGRYEIKTGALDLGKAEVALFPLNGTLDIDIDRNRASVSSEWTKDNCILEVACGYTLFDEDGKVVAERTLSPARQQNDASPTRSTTGNATFSLADPAAAYYVAPHVVTEDGLRFYGEKVPLATIVGKWGFLYEDVLYPDGDHKIGEYGGESGRWTLTFNADGTGTIKDKDETSTLNWSILKDNNLKYSYYTDGQKITHRYSIEKLTPQRIYLSEISDSLPKCLILIFERID